MTRTFWTRTKKSSIILFHKLSILFSRNRTITGGRTTSNIKTKSLKNRIDSLNIVRRIVLLKKNLILKTFISLILTKSIMSICRILRSICTDLSNKLLHSCILIGYGLLSTSVNVSSLKLCLSRKNRAENLNQSSISRSINLAFGSGRSHTGSSSTGGNGSAVTSHSTKHRIKTGSLKITNLTLVSSIAHVFLPGTALSGFLSIELHSQGILTLLPVALLRSHLSAFSGIF